LGINQGCSTGIPNFATTNNTNKYAINTKVKAQNHTTKAKEPASRQTILQPKLQHPALAFTEIGITENESDLCQLQ
jgi:hypothetical protein